MTRLSDVLISTADAPSERASESRTIKVHSVASEMLEMALDIPHLCSKTESEPISESERSDT
jgi:hypothetical protein